MKKILLTLLLLPTLLFSQGTPRAGGINNGIAPVIPGAIHDNFVGVQHTNSNSFGVYSFTTTFNYQFGLKTTNDLAEGSVNKYFSETLARNAFTNGFGLDYSAGVYSLNSSVQGILSSVSNKFNIPTGLTTQYLRGDGSLATLPTVYSFTGTNLQYTKGDGTYATFPSIPAEQIQSDWNASSGIGVILNKPTLFSGSYLDLTNKPIIPTNTNQLTNGSGFITSIPSQTFVSLTGKPSTLIGYGITDAYPLTGNPSGFLTTIPAQSWTSIIGKPSFATVATSGSYNDLINKPTIPTVKRQETYSGTTNSSGNYTVTFGTAYSVAPNIQICLINPNVRDTPIVTVTTTGFTVNIQRRTDVIGLLPTYANVNSGAVDVLITEK